MNYLQSGIALEHLTGKKVGSRLRTTSVSPLYGRLPLIDYNL